MTAGFSGALIQFALSNLAIALPLSLLAWWLQERGRRPLLAHLLWLVVLVKLLTPPLYSLPVIAVPADRAPAALSLDPQPPLADEQAASPLTQQRPRLAARAPGWQTTAVGIWLAGSVIVLLSSALRIRRFDRLLRGTSRPASEGLQRACRQLAESLGVERVPALATTSAKIPPMVWCLGGRPRIYVPLTIAEQVSPAEIHAILAHELGHVRRGDHLVRWLEYVACVALWWNPVTWWARRNLRVCEEIGCDALALSKTGMSRDVYATAFLSTMAFLATPSHPPELASHVNGGSIERRIRMILSGQSMLETPRWLRRSVLVSAVLVAPLGLTFAQDDGTRIVTLTSQDVVAGELPAFVPSALTARISELSQNPEAIGPEYIVIGDSRSRFESEAVDPAWAPAMEAAIYSAVSATATDALRIRELACRTTVCRVIIDQGEAQSRLDQTALAEKFDEDSRLVAESLRPLAGNANGIGLTMVTSSYEGQGNVAVFTLNRRDLAEPDSPQP